MKAFTVKVSVWTYEREKVIPDINSWLSGWEGLQEYYSWRVLAVNSWICSLSASLASNPCPGFTNTSPASGLEDEYNRVLLQISFWTKVHTRDLLFFPNLFGLFWSHLKDKIETLPTTHTHTNSETSNWFYRLLVRFYFLICLTDNFLQVPECHLTSCFYFDFILESWHLFWPFLLWLFCTGPWTWCQQ